MVSVLNLLILVELSDYEIIDDGAEDYEEENDRYQGKIEKDKMSKGAGYAISSNSKRS